MGLFSTVDFMKALNIRNTVLFSYYLQTKKKQIKYNHTILSNLLFLTKFGLAGVTLSLMSFTSYSALSIQTLLSMQETKSSFFSNGDVLTSVNELLSFSYKDASGAIVYVDASKAGAKFIVNSKMKENELVTLVDMVQAPTGSAVTNSNSHSDLSTTGIEHHLMKNMSVKGGVTATLLKDGIIVTPADRPFDGCSSYQLRITLPYIADSANNLNIHSNYIDVDRQDGSDISGLQQSVTYTLVPDEPYACYAQVNLDSEVDNEVQPVEQWNSIKGFKRQSTVNIDKNFPTMGFNYAYFNLILTGTTAKQVIHDSATVASRVYGLSSKDVYLELSTTEKPNVLKITLRGPSDKQLPVRNYSPTTFRLKSGSTEVYSFTINKWFVARNDVDSHYNSRQSPDAEFCASIGNGGYTLPSLADYSDGIETGLTESIVTHVRRIGKGLFSEWGNINNTTYPNSDFDSAYYWAKNMHSNGLQYYIDSSTGDVNYNVPDTSFGKTVCVNK